jgi:hypothetical protein
MTAGYTIYKTNGKYIGRSALSDPKAAFALYLLTTYDIYKDSDVSIIPNEDGSFSATYCDDDYILTPFASLPRGIDTVPKTQQPAK